MTAIPIPPDGRRFGTKKASLILLLILLFGCPGCTGSTAAPNPALPEMRIDLENGKTVYNGLEQRFYQVEPGQSGLLTISVQAQEGSLSIYVFPTGEPNHYLYRGRDIPSSTFTVGLPDAGEYTVWVEADHFSGSYELVWSIPETEVKEMP